MSDDNRVVFSLLETGVDLQSRDLNDTLPIQLDNTLVRPCDLIDVSSGHLETAHLYLVLSALRPAQVFVWFEVARHEELGLVDVWYVLLGDDLFDPVERVDEPESAVVAFDQLFCLQFLDGFVEAAEVEGPIANRT